MFAKHYTGKLWALKMLFVWRWRLGYWDFDAFAAAWNTKRTRESWDELIP
jgi:hypothetical protein